MRHLRLKDVGLDRCPEGIDHLNKLETLDLSDNRIDTLEQSTASLFKLKMLDLSGNNIPVRVYASFFVDEVSLADTTMSMPAHRSIPHLLCTLFNIFSFL